MGEARIAEGYLRARRLAMPVADVRLPEIHDSFDEDRSGGRPHHAIDILAPRGTAVLSADDGRILRVSSNRLGGLTVYAKDAGGLIVYYYAHLDGYRRGLAAGQVVSKGDTLGFVGTTGNAPKNTPHLHFQVTVMPRDGRYWEGEALDPYPLLEPQDTGAAQPSRP